MPSPRFSLTTQTLRDLKVMLKNAEHKGDLRTVKRVNSVLALVEGFTRSAIADILNVCEESIRLWFTAFLLKGPSGIKSNTPPGRPPKLTKTQKTQLDQIITMGPVAAGYPGACWRSPMIQHLIHERFGVFYSVGYIVQLLKNMGFSYQKARFVSDHKDPEKRAEWLRTGWPEILQVAKQKEARILFGDEASFPQWGSLSYTRAKKGHQPVVKTSGTRKAYKVFGLIDYFSGRFFCKAHEGRLNSDSYAAFLTEVVEKSDEHLILIQDGARYHTGKVMKEFFEKHAERLTVYQLPSYSPDYNPIEKLWKKIKEKEVHLQYFPTFESLKAKVEEALLRFQSLENEILTLFGFYRQLPSTDFENTAVNM